eukprot:g4782.t1
MTNSKTMSRLREATEKNMSSEPNWSGHTPLHICAGCGSVDTMKTLIELGARVDARALSSATPLHVAVQAGQLGAVRLLVLRSAPLEARDWCGKTALHHACDFARMNGLDNTAARALIEAGANVHSLDICCQTPATLAMQAENPHLMMFMLRHGSKPCQDVARLYADECMESKYGDELLGVLADFGWAPPPPRSNVGGSGGSGGTTSNTSSAWSESDRIGSVRGRRDYRHERRQGEDSTLHDAVCLNDGGAHLAELLATTERNPNVLDTSGDSPLMVAAYLGCAAMVQVLLGAGATPDLRRPKDGMTALHTAATRGHVEVTELMLAASLSNNDGKKNACSTPTSFFFPRGFAPFSGVMKHGASSPPSPRAAAATKTTEARKARSVVDVMDDVGKRPLHYAATCNNIQVMNVLLGAGADVDCRDKRGGTPLFYAAKEDNAESVIALLKAGASPDIKNSSGYAALHMAVQRPAAAVMKALIAAGASPGVGGERGITPLHVACEWNAGGTVEALLRAGAVPGHCWNDYLESPLLLACRCGSLNAVKVLLPHLSPRQINMRNRTIGVYEGGETPLVAAIWCEYLDEWEKIEVVEALLGAGADPTLRTSSDMDPLSAVILGFFTKTNPALGPPMIRALVAAGADVNGVRSPRGFAPLHLACYEGACAEVVEALLDAGADPCMPCAGSMQEAGMPFMTPLQLAGAGGSVEAVSVLIGHPACGGLNAVGALPSRATVLACAVQHGQTEVCRFLLELGADMDILPFYDDKSRAGKRLPPESLIEMAAKLGHLDAMKLLIQAKMLKDQAEEEETGEARWAVLGAGNGGVKVS